MQQSVGELLRQLRRQRSLTQTQLGGDQFSKSYVSAVEREKIVPSSEALRFFAKQLEQSSDYFIALAQENEQARQYLNSTHDLRTAGQLYLGLGYCTYAYTYQNTVPSDSTLPSTHRLTEEDMERDMRHALSFLIQSRTIYQVCSDTLGESNVRLVQAMVLLDLCTRRKQFALAKSPSNDMYTRLNYIAPLDDAEEQCRQVLLMWEESFTASHQPVQELTDILYVALAYLIRIFAQRAAFARLGGYKDTTERELTLATQLCQQALDTLTATNVSWNVIHDAAYIQMSQLMHHAASLPRVPQQHDVFPKGIKTPAALGKIEIFFAAGEVIEDLGHNATKQEYAHECYQPADQCFQVPLAFPQPSMIISEHDAGDKLRRYQRYISILEERLHLAPLYAEETTKALLSVLKDGLALSQYTL